MNLEVVIRPPPKPKMGVVEVTSDTNRMEAIFAEALRLEQQGEWEQALAQYEELAAKFEGGPNAAYALSCASRLRDRLNNRDIEAVRAEHEQTKECLAEAEASLAKQRKKPRRIPWFFLSCVALVVVAFYTNPDLESLKKTVSKNIAENQAKAGMLEKLAGNVLVTQDFERKNYYLFSIGTVTSEVRFGGPQLRVEILGAFGRWWFELLDTPLYETRTDKQQ